MNSTPVGGSVEVIGPIKAVGITPFYAPRFPVGSYKVSVGRQGYYTRSSRVLLSAGDSIHVTAQLKPKSALGGFLRSAVIPGWGQHFNERHGRGVLFLGAELAAAGTAVYLSTQYNHAVTRYEQMADSLAAATTAEEVALYTHKLAEREAAFHRKKDNATTAAYIAMGIWAVQALDALIFGPVREDLPSVSLEATTTTRSTAALPQRPDAAHVGLTVRF